MDEKWTPGPWRVQRRKDSIDGWQTEIAAGTYDVVSAVTHDPVRRRADANLIAAAPDLYKALDALNGFVLSFYGGDELHSIPPECVDATLALSKASGQPGVGPTEEDKEGEDNG